MVAETDIGICKITFLEEEHKALEELKVEFPEANIHAHHGKYISLVEKYFNDWEIPDDQIVLDLKGTPFQLQVWRALISIPSAHLLAYQDIANMIKNPGAVRAVGSAIGRNPIAYLIPCHRVIRQSGQMGDYRWGSSRKIAINGYESACLI